MKGRRNMTLPLLSMLDLLFGVFGSMIALAAIFASTIRAQPEVTADESMLFVAVEVRGQDDQIDLSKLYVSFELVGTGNQLQRLWSPVEPAGETASDEVYTTASDKDLVAASLLVKGGNLAKHESPRLRASLQNLAQLADMGVSASQNLSITVAVKKGLQSCSASTFQVDLAELMDEDKANGQFAPAIFRNSKAPKDRCFGVSGSQPPPMFEIREGAFAAAQ